MKKNRTIGVLFGGPSEEYEVSCKSAETIVRGLREAGHNVLAIGISKTGRWYAPVADEAIANFKAEEAGVAEVTLLPRPGGDLYRLSDFSKIAEIDVIFPIVHGKTGEDGRLQGFLDLCRLPYVGAGCAGSAVGMDKVYMRDILKGHGIAQTDYYVIMRTDWQRSPDEVAHEVMKALPFPLFVKPANSGSSVGISRAIDLSSLKDAIALAARYDRKILIEKAVEKREIELAVMGNDVIEVSLPGEVLADQAFYDYRSKYQSAESRTEVPANLSPEKTREIQSLGRKIYKALDLWGLCRVDFFLENDSERVILNEVNTLPGFTDISMYSKMWAESGKALPQLLDELVQLALEHDAEMAQTSITI